MKIPSLLILLLFFACACATLPEEPAPGASTGQPGAYAPRAGDSSLEQSAVYLDSAVIQIMESLPVQVSVTLQGNLPTPCHQLRLAVSPPDAGNRIDVNAYSLTEPGQICVMMLQPFEAVLPLGSFSPGHYTIRVNGEAIGEFDG